MLICIIQHHVLEMAWNIWNYFLCVIEYKTFQIREVTAELLRTGQICYKLFGPTSEGTFFPGNSD